MNIATSITAYLTQVGFRQGPAHSATSHMFSSLIQSTGETHCPIAIALQQLQRHSLGGLWAHTGQTAQGINQFVYQRAEHNLFPISGESFERTLHSRCALSCHLINSSKGHLETRRHLHATGEFFHLFPLVLLDLPDGIIDSRCQ